MTDISPGASALGFHSYNVSDFHGTIVTFWDICDTCYLRGRRAESKMRIRYEVPPTL